MTVSFVRPSLARLLLASAAAGFLLAGAPAQAQQPAAAPAAQEVPPAKLQLAKDVVDANGEARSFDNIVPNILEQAANSFVQANPDLIRDLREVAVGLVPEFEKRKGEIVDILARTYAVNFTETELKEMLAFYRTQTGRKMVEQRQAMVDQGLRGVQQWGRGLAREMEDRVRQEMKKRGFTI
ncbi:DUF2059 domain-containing protein [Ancylobacter terrae]|uniref:DUF2059 domain-containing protein n=1 Tax=Ancylobacter sp. sgz301288 TaxID=3342077 RepID=UPI00385DFE9F